jgi:ligand-binding sensor domain-containing protein/signal transduction histidine kinase
MNSSVTLYRQLLVLLCLGLASLAARAASDVPWSIPQFSGRVWHVEHGLPRNIVQSIAQTPDGYLWIGTQSGLARFDGEQFEWVELPSSNASSQQYINDLCVTRDGELWIATGGRGLFAYKNGKLEQHLPNELNQVILSLVETPEGDLLCGTRRGLLRYREGTFSLIGDPNAPHLSAKQRIAVNTIRSIAADPKGNYLIAVPGEILELSGSEACSKQDMSNVNSDAFIRAIFSEPDGTIWIGSNAGLTQWKNGSITHYNKANGLPDNTVNTIYRDRANNLWIGTYGGICRFVNGNFVITTGDDGEPFDQILCFFEDRENNLWAGGKDGVCQLNQRQFYTLTTRHGLSHNNVISVQEDKQKTLWVGTWGGGLQALRDGKIESFSTQHTPELKSDLVLGLQSAKDNTLWFSTDYDGGLYRIIGSQLLRFPPTPGFTNVIRALVEDDDKKMWIGTVGGGVWSLDGKKLAHYGKKEGITNNAIRCLCRASDDSMWVGTEGGLFHYQNKRFTAYGKEDGLSDGFILSLYEDRNKTLWIGTSEGGLNCFRDGKFKSYTTRDGLLDNAVLEIIEDNLETLWMTSFRGISAIKRKDIEMFDRHEVSHLAPRHFNKDDGMSSSICISSAKPAACKSSDGKLWFATTKGLCVTDPTLKVPRNEAIPPVLLRSLIAGKQELPLDKSPRIEAGHNDLEFHYIALSYQDPERNSFKYKLEGFDADWIDARERKVAYYNNLGPGDYVFHVIASNNDGVWNNKGAQIAFVLLPHVWQTWWFKSAAVMLSLSLVGFSARVFTKRRMQRRLRFVEQQHAIEKERSRIAQDMHDEVGAKLTKITFLGSVAKQRLGSRDEAEVQIERISQTARELIGSLDEIVWAVDPKNDTLENFANYLCRYASEFFENSSVLCELQIPTELPHVSVTADVRHNLILAVKESLNNALKHANATKVVVRLSAMATHIDVVVHDNGTGLPVPDPSELATKRSGNGLRNMQDRLHSVGGTCRIESSVGGGTVVTFVVHLKPSQKRTKIVS